MKSKVVYLSLAILSLFVGLSLIWAAGEKIYWWSINSGGEIYSSSPSYELYGTMGQPLAGEAISNSYRNYAGFANPSLNPSDVEEKETTIPSEFSVSQNYPNPFNPQTVIEYSLPIDCHVNIIVYNVLGQSVRRLKNEWEQAGRKSVVWDGKDQKGEEVGTGIYFYKIRAGDFVKTKKMVLLK